MAGQSAQTDSAAAIPMFQIMGGLQKAEADLVTRFGTNGFAGGGFLMKSKSGFMYGIDGIFQFGNQIKDTALLDHLMSNAGFIISEDGMAMDVFVYQRGFQFMAKAGYMFPVLQVNPNSGPFILAGAGFWQHRVRLEMKYGETPSLSPAYRKGYDRLTNGFAINQLVGYQFLSQKRLVNFFIAAEVTEGFLQGRRDVIFDTGQPGNLKRFDMTWGVRLGWSIPIYERKKSSSRYYYY